MSGASPTLAYLDPALRRFELVRAASIFTEERIEGGDGWPLTIYEAGDPTRPTVLLASPLGISCLMLVRLVRRLARSFHVLTWESRGLPDYRPSDSDADWEPQAHCRDLLAVVGHKRRSIRHVVSYCSGANVAAYALIERLISCSSFCMISPPLDTGASGARTIYQAMFLPLLPRIAADGVRFAALVRAMLQQPLPEPASGLAYELAAINNQPFVSAEHTYRYAQLHAPWLALKWAPLLSWLPVPTLVVHGARDDFIHAETVGATAAAIPQCRLEMIADAGHFGVCDSEEVLHQVESFFVGDGGRPLEAGGLERRPLGTSR